MANLQQVVARLGMLSEEELRTVKLTADHLLGSVVNGQEKVDDEDELFLFYSQIVNQLADKGIKALPWYALQTRPIYHDLAKKFPDVERYTQKYFGKLNRPKRQRLYSIYVMSMITWMSNQPMIPINTKTVLSRVDRIPEFMDKSFPGYLESGLLPLLIEVNGK